MFSYRVGSGIGKERPGWLSVGCGWLDYIGREKKMNFLISVGASEPAIILLWDSKIIYPQEECRDFAGRCRPLFFKFKARINFL